jgi:DNA-binding CsgD family transcriptional regulator
MVNSDNHLREVEELRKENLQLQAQLKLHQRLFSEVHDALKTAENLFHKQSASSNLITKLQMENELLKNQLRMQRLSMREREILSLIVAGDTSKVIADKLQISKLTVDTHRKNIQQKLGVENPVELIKLALSSEFE